MNHSHDTQLNRLLEDWAGKRAASEEDLTALRRKIGEQLNRNHPVALELPLRSTSTRRYVAIGLAAAAVLLLAFGVWRSPLGKQPTDTTLQFATLRSFDSAGSFQVYWRKHLLHQKQLLSEYRKVFGQGITWVTETEQSCDVGLLPSDLANRLPSEYIVVQLWLVAHNQQSGQSVVRTISVLAGRDEVVELPAAAGGGHLVLWAHPVDEAMISIDLRYQPDSIAGVEIDSSHLQQIGQVTNIHSFEQDGVEYKLYQSADLIHHKLG